MKLNCLRDLVGNSISLLTDTNSGGIISRPEKIIDVSYVAKDPVSLLPCIRVKTEYSELSIHGYHVPELGNLINESCDTDKGIIIDNYIIFFN